MSQVLSSGPNGFSPTFAYGYVDKTISAGGGELTNFTITVTDISATASIFLQTSVQGGFLSILTPPYVWTITANTITVACSISNGTAGDLDARIYYEVLQ